jgi:serine/threonine-protein kinase
MARLDHPAILPVYDSRIDERGVAFFSMKLVNGETLEDTLTWAASLRLDPEFLRDLIEVFVKVCEGVAFAHGRGILHLDLKPSNVMVADFGRVYVIDWGVALPFVKGPFESGAAPVPVSNRGGLLVGTPHYMAPEQLNGMNEHLDERTDVFALGAILYQILTGEPPRDLERPIAFGAPLEITPPESIAGDAFVPGALSRIAMKAMSHDPADRYGSVDEMTREVRMFLARSNAFDGDRPDADSKLLGPRSPLDDVGRIEDARCPELFSNAKDVDVEPLGSHAEIAQQPLLIHPPAGRLRDAFGGFGEPLPRQ